MYHRDPNPNFNGVWRHDVLEGCWIATVVCHWCQTEANNRFGSMTHGDRVRQQIERKTGWINKGGRWKCSTCQITKKESKPMVQSTHVARPIPVAVTPTAPPVPTVQPNMKQARAIMDLIETHFDERAGRWKSGYSDERVALDLNVPRAMVTLVRDEAYGPLRVPTEIEAIAGDMATLRKMLDELEGRLKIEIAKFK